MAHPHAAKVKASNSAKMRAIGPKGGGAGTAFAGMSPFKRVGQDGEQESFNAHSKGFENGYAHGGKVKARGDRFARGGKTKQKAKGDVNIAIINPHGKPAGMPAPGGAPPGLGATGQPSPTPPPQGAIAPAGMPPGGGVPPGGLAGLAGGGAGGGGLGALLGGGGMKAAGGRIKKQTGGAVPYDRRTPDTSQHLPGGEGQMPSPGMGPGPGFAHTQPPPPPPSPTMGAQMDSGVMPPGAGGDESEKKKGGRTSFQFKKGGEVWQANRIGKAEGGRTIGHSPKGKMEGEMPSKEKHWAKYSDDNRKSKHGNSGESEELTLSTPDKRESDLGKADKRARGGRLGTTSKRKGGKPGAGQQTGEARLQQYRRGVF